MSLETVQRVLTPDLAQVEQKLLERTASAYEFVDIAVRHVIEGGGKRLRPMLLLLSAKSLGYDNGAMHELAAAMELIHVASLAHDDVIDEARLRRNRETLNAQFGNKVAVLVGDYMHARVLAILMGCQASDAILRVVADATQSMCEGEVIAAHKDDDFELALDDYLKIVELKTAKLIAACCTIGALLATEDRTKIEALTTYGHCVGIAFQIVDDVLDLIGNASKFGKPTRNDLREGKLTLPVMVARDRATPIERERLERLYIAESRSSEDVEWIVSLIARYEATSYALDVARDYSRDAKDALSVLEPSTAREALLELADSLISRDH